jgi:hypothetical protein
MRTLGGLIAWVVLLGCTARSNADEGASDTEETGVSIPDESEGESETGESETGEPACTEETCDAACSLELDECGNEMTGYCALAYTCECYESEPCIDCESDADCDQWEQCHPEFGCDMCWSTTAVEWDPELACGLDLSGVDPLLVPSYIQLEIAGELVPFTESCDAMPAAAVWLDDLQIQLCPDTCAAFEDAGHLAVIINCPGGP